MPGTKQLGFIISDTINIILIIKFDKCSNTLNDCFYSHLCEMQPLFVAYDGYFKKKPHIVLSIKAVTAGRCVLAFGLECTRVMRY